MVWFGAAEWLEPGAGAHCGPDVVGSTARSFPLLTAERELAFWVSCDWDAGGIDIGAGLGWVGRGGWTDVGAF
jgi:hypothetical protein